MLIVSKTRVFQTRVFLWNQDWKFFTQFADAVFFTPGGVNQNLLKEKCMGCGGNLPAAQPAAPSSSCGAGAEQAAQQAQGGCGGSGGCGGGSGAMTAPSVPPVDYEDKASKENPNRAFGPPVDNTPPQQNLLTSGMV